MRIAASIAAAMLALAAFAEDAPLLGASNEKTNIVSNVATVKQLSLIHI